ncbi:MAG: hypothetical protein ACLQK8_05545 [Streptosporangiaceae bacterium]
MAHAAPLPGLAGCRRGIVLFRFQKMHGRRVSMRIGTLILVVWLVIGAIAAGQRHYYSSNQSCAKAGTIAVTIIAGPLNYVGVNPKLSCGISK